MTGEQESLKKQVVASIDAQRQALIDLSLRIHANPEEGFQEEQASGWLCAYLEEQGFAVERNYCDLATAFLASTGNERPRIALLAEYDALPGLGHACGHNLIAAMSVGAATAAKSIVDATGGSIAVIGTPAEEVYGGKAIMAERGAFKGLDAAMMVHPGSRNSVLTGALACTTLYVEYFGREAHAASRPEQGINALDALLLAFNAVAALRQHIRDSARVHGIITHGGDAPNVVPGHTTAVFLVRAADEAYLEEMKQRTLACFQAGAEATGARLEYRWDEVQYAPLHTNVPLAEAFRRNLTALGRVVEDPPSSRAMGSTDVGNVSMLVPTIHPSIAVAPRETSIHTPEFARLAAAKEGHAALIDAAKALAMTAVDLLVDDDLRKKTAAAFAAERF